MSSHAIAYQPEQLCPTQLSEDNVEKLTDATSFESRLGKCHSAPLGLGAGQKRKHETEVGEDATEPRKQIQKSEPAATSQGDPEERLKLPGDESLSNKQKVQFEETIPKPNGAAIGSPENLSKERGVREVEQEQRQHPISYWAAHHTWPDNFAEYNPMTSTTSVNKRQRTSDETSRSYSQNRKDGAVPEQYSAAYEVHILSKGLDMNPFKGEDLISRESKHLCIDLQLITRKTIEPTIFPNGVIRRVLDFCRNRNEAIVLRDVTPMIIPSIISLYFGGDNSLEHVVDEVNADWYRQCVIEGPQLRPDLAIGLSSSAFTDEEIFKLKMYASVDNWAQVTPQMFFPFLMCEVKCGREGLNMADRQNMHSCSVAVRAVLRLEQEADKYREKNDIGKKADSLNGQILAFSISHDQEDARLYGHYAIIQGDKLAYYRYRIRKFDLTDSSSLLAIHNFVRNLLKSYLPVHVQRLKDALAALPESLESSGPPGSSGLSFTASGMALNDENVQQPSQVRDAEGFVVPPPPDRSRQSAATSLASVQSQLEKSMQEVEKLAQEKVGLAQDKVDLMQQLASMQSQLASMQSQLDQSLQDKSVQQQVST